MARTTKPESRLKAAVEVSADRVIAARADRMGTSIEAAASRSLRSGTITPSLVNSNVHDRAELAAVVHDALTAVGARGEVALVLPDASTRISLLDFDTLPERRAEADSIVRFRLRKALPFDVDDAALSYEVQSAGNGVRVIAAVVLREVRDEYEQAIRDAGFAPGVVVPSMAAVLGVVDASRPTLVIKTERGTMSLAIVNEEQLLLFRNIELPMGAVEPAQISDDVYPSLVFFEDTYQTRVEQLYVGGVATQQMSSALEQATGLRPQELVFPSVFTGAASAGVDRALMGGVVGALIG